MTSFDLFINNFHFIRPLWLLAIFILLLVVWQLKKHRFYQSPWQQLLPQHLSQVLVENTSSSNNGSKKSITDNSFLLKPFIIGLLSIIALAGPAWQKLPQPVYQTERGSVLIMDMSYSMFATDIKPNRLTRARFKAIDLLNKINEGDTGLIAYAGDAFVISPLTQDVKNIALLLPSLTPEIMPVPGANPLAALTLAHEMLLNAGHLNGDIYWFTDDVDNQEINDIYQWSAKFGHQLNILGIGSESGAPITLPSGELLKDNSGAIVIPRLPSQKLSSLASRGKGSYQTIKNDDSDINKLINKDNVHEKNEKQQSQQTGDQWQEQGAWLLIFVLPLLLSYFRRGSTVLMLPFSCLPLLLLLSFSIITPSSFAAQDTKKENLSNEIQPKNAASAHSSSSFWQNLWQTNDQQAQAQYNQENYQEAAKKFDNPQWQGSAHYKAGNYEAALESFKQGDQANNANSLYNQGNALAQLQQYDKAIESYEKALSKNPDLQDAKNNLEIIKQKQKEQQQQQKQQGDQSQDSQDQKNQENQENQQQDSQSQEKQSQEDQQKSDSNTDTSEQQQQDSENGSQKSNEDQQSKSEDKSESKSEEQKAKEAEEKQQAEQEKQAAEKSEKKDEQNEQGKEKTAAQIAAEQQEKETEQKHQQLLNKVTDDPYLLLRNKMQLEYQKRKQNGTSQGVNKQW